MPQNVAVGKEADAVADFVSKYAGSKAKTPPAPSGTTGSESASGATEAK